MYVCIFKYFPFFYFPQDFMSIESVPFTRDGLLEKTPAHNYSEFRFRIYASHAFRVFRRLFEIDKEFFVTSLCSEPMVELSAAGASGSIFYVTRDDNFICKTVQHKEAEFLQKILPGINNKHFDKKKYFRFRKKKVTLIHFYAHNF